MIGIFQESPTLGLLLFIGLIVIVGGNFLKYKKLKDTDYLLIALFAAFVYISKKGISLDWINSLGQKYFPDIANPTPIILGIFAIILIYAYKYYKRQKIKRRLFP